MNKLKELLFLKSLKRVGKATIYKKYWDILNSTDEYYDLVSEVEINSNFSKEDITKAMDNAEHLYDHIITNPDIDVITVFDDNYPEKLNVMGNKRPVYLYIKGNMDALFKPNIAVIGTRKPSELSKDFEAEMVKKVLDESDRVILSGLAQGCDKIAHKTTVDEDRITIAVLPSGINRIVPSNHKELATNIIEKGGCLISEYEPNADAFKNTFVQRDQIVAALSDAIIVVECGIKSGTMHTVDFAEEYGKQLFAYLPEDKQGVPFDGNEFILENKNNAFKVADIDSFCKSLDNPNDNDNYESKKKSLKFSKKSGQTTFNF